MTNDRWKEAGLEPRIEELLADPIAELVMKRDGIDDADVWAAVDRACRTRGMPGSAPTAPSGVIAPLVLAK